MHYLIFLLVVTFAHGQPVGKSQNVISPTETGKNNNIHEYISNDKNNHLITKYKSVDVQGSKDIFKDENEKVSVGDEGLKNEKNYNSKPILKVANGRGDNLKVFSLSNSTGNKLAAMGNASILNTNKHVISTGGFVEHNDFKSGRSTTYNSSLEYTNKNKLNVGLSAQHDSKSGNKVSAGAKYNIMSNDNNKLSATGFFDRNMPTDTAAYHNYGGSLDFSHRDAFDANLDVKHSGDSGRTDLKLSGKVKPLGLEIVVGATKSGPENSIKPLLQITIGDNS